MGEDLLEPLLNWPLSSAEFWHCMLPLVHAHIMDCTLMHKMNEQPIYRRFSRWTKHIGSDIQQPEATHTYILKRDLKEVALSERLTKIHTNVQDRTKSTRTTMIIQPQCSHSNTMSCSSTRESTSSWKEHEFHFMTPSWPPLKARVVRPLLYKQKKCRYYNNNLPIKCDHTQYYCTFII